MKTIVFSILVLLLFCISESYSYRAPDSCLKSWSSGQYERHPNPDSIRVDTCEDSPTFMMEYVKRNFRVRFDTELLNFDNSVSSNDTLFITWQNIKQQYSRVRNILRTVEEKFSTYRMFVKDTATYPKRQFIIEFDNYVPIRNVVKHLDSMIFDTLAKVRAAVYLDVRWLSTIDNDEQVMVAKDKDRLMSVSIGTNTLWIRPIQDIVHCTMYSLMGDKITISYSELERRIVLSSELAKGIYFVKMNSDIYTYIHQ